MENERFIPSCLVLIYGIPASGKTLLATNTLKYIKEKQTPNWNMFTIHFDDFYPTDVRSKGGSPQEEISREHFHLKQTRHLVNSCLESVLILNFPREKMGVKTLNGANAKLTSPISDNLQFHKFLQHLNQKQDPPILNDLGRLEKEYELPTVFILDDNMPLRSMRHEYYQMARNYQMGFAEVCITCPLRTALLRNSMRPVPIPESTILAMERSIEIPEPARHHWERRSVVITSEDGDPIMSAYEKILLLIKEALANPVLPMAQETDPNTQELSRLANLNSYIHQADIITRKCVSEVLKDSSMNDKAPKAILAKGANVIRLKILEDVRKGLVTSGQRKWEVDKLNHDQFKIMVLEVFQASIKQEMESEK